MLRALLAVALMVLFSGHSQAQVLVDDLPTGVHTSLKSWAIRVWGPIVPGMDEDFKRAISRFDNISLVSVNLDSDGGDIDTAMKIGRMIRKSNLSAIIPYGGRCYSSCALIYVGAVDRKNFGVLGLHRPYLAGEPLRSEMIGTTLNQVFEEVRVYLSEMNITPSFFEIMVNTPPEQVKRYHGKETDVIVPRLDIVYDEKKAAKEATKYGISTGEYRKRFVAGNRCYSTYGKLDSNDPKIPSRAQACAESLLWGITAPEFELRFWNAHQCIGSENPGLCEREIMTGVQSSAH
ncbi:COG3904 family protein [Mesorhizobium sp. A556]